VFFEQDSRRDPRDRCVATIGFGNASPKETATTTTDPDGEVAVARTAPDGRVPDAYTTLVNPVFEFLHRRRDRIYFVQAPLLGADAG
jgi:hypothetical protein